MDNFSTLSDQLLHHPDEAFKSILPYVLLATVAFIVLHFVLSLLGGRAGQTRRRWGWFAGLVYLATVISVATLGVTSFYAVLRYGILDGWWLFAHMFGAGAFVFVLPVLAMTWGMANRFGSRAVRDDETGDEGARFFWLPKSMFWLLLVSGLAVCLTMLLSMLPIFGTEGLEVLLNIHRYAGLVAVVALAIHLYCVVIQRLRLR